MSILGGGPDTSDDEDASLVVVNYGSALETDANYDDDEESDLGDYLTEEQAAAIAAQPPMVHPNRHHHHHFDDGTGLAETSMVTLSPNRHDVGYPKPGTPGGACAFAATCTEDYEADEEGVALDEDTDEFQDAFDGLAEKLNDAFSGETFDGIKHDVHELAVGVRNAATKAAEVTGGALIFSVDAASLLNAAKRKGMQFATSAAEKGENVRGVLWDLFAATVGNEADKLEDEEPMEAEGFAAAMTTAAFAEVVVEATVDEQTQKRIDSPKP